MRTSILALAVFALLTLGTTSVSADPALESGASVWDQIILAFEAVADGLAEYLGGDGAPESANGDEEDGGLPDLGPMPDPNG